MRILLLCSAFNGLSQRARIDLCDAGHDVRVRLAGDEDSICSTVADVDPDIIICPFLRERVPSEVWTRYRTIIVHPGPPGDRGASSLDWAITDAHATWGVTALQATEEMDAGPIVLQAAVPVSGDDDAASLAARILEQEHRIYPEAVRLFAEGRLRVVGRTVQIT